MTKLSELVDVLGDFKPSVSLPYDFYDPKINKAFVEGYYPTQDTLKIFQQIAESLRYGSADRARMFTGTFGTGKSDLMLMIANYVTRGVDEAIMQPFFQRLRTLNAEIAEVIIARRRNKAPFLLVLEQADIAPTFNSFILNGLIKSLEREDLKSLLGPTIYQAARERIGTWRERFPTHLEKLRQQLAHFGQSIEQFEAEFNSPRAELALNRFRGWHEEITSAPFIDYTAIQRPGEAFESVAKQLPEDKYSGIFVIIDELSQLLEQLAQNPSTAEVKGMDNLVELATRPERDIHLHTYMVSLEAFSAAGGMGTDKQGRIALEKSGGRFVHHHPLTSANIEELVSSAIIKYPTQSQRFPDKQRDELVEMAGGLWSNRSATWLKDTIVEGAFPLHPLTLYVLPRLNSRFAQNERTMFRFLTHKELGLYHFIHSTDYRTDANGWYPLLTIDRLYPYFAEALRTKNPTLTEFYERASARLSDEQINGLEGRIVQALVILRAISERALEPKFPLLYAMLNLPASRRADVEDALRVLERHDIGFLSESGKFQINLPGETSPQEIIRKVESYLRDNTIDWLTHLNIDSPGVIRARTFNAKHGTARTFAQRFTILKELGSPATVQEWLKDNDGMVVYMVVTTDMERQQAIQQAMEVTKFEPRLVVAVPKSTTDLPKWVQLELASNAVKNSMKGTREQDLQFLTKYALGHQKTKDDVRRIFLKPSHLDWIFGGSLVTVEGETDLEGVASSSMQSLFRNAPRHSLQQHINAPGKLSTYVKRAIEKIVEGMIKLPVGSKTKSSPEDEILRKGALPLGLIRHVRTENGFDYFEASMPNLGDHNFIAWNYLEILLQQGSPWVTVIKNLKNVPYGLYESVIALYFATFYALHWDEVSISKAGGSRVKVFPVTDSVIADLVTKPTSYRVVYEPLPSGQRRYLKALFKEMNNHQEPRGNLREEIEKTFQVWAPTLARSFSHTDWETFFPDATQETRQLVYALVHLTGSDKQGKRVEEALQVLPQLIYLESDHDKWNESELNKAMETIRQALQMVVIAKTRLEEYLIKEINTLFGGEGNAMPKTVWERAHAWRAERTFVQRVPQNSNATKLLDVFKTASDFHDLFLVRLPNSYGIQFDSTIGKAQQYLQYLSSAIRDVEQEYQKTASVPVTPPVPSTGDRIEIPRATTKNPPLSPSTSGNTGRTALLGRESIPKPIQGEPEKSPSPATNMTGNTATSSSKVDSAFQRVKLEIQSLSESERQDLLQRLRKLFDL